MTRALLWILITSILAAAAWADEDIRLTLQTSASGATIDRHLFGQFAEHLGRGIYEGIWVGRDSSPSVDSINTFADPRKVHPTLVSAAVTGGKLGIDLPPHSVTVVALQ